MSTSTAINHNDVIRFYERVNRLKPSHPADPGRITTQSFIDISAEAKKKFVLELARDEVLERIKR
ncbi:MAG: hypothetical protein AB1585_16585 [Thermodesulfobacteriota bacterium]